MTKLYPPDSVPRGQLPLGVGTALIWGGRENFVAEEPARSYVAAARASGDHAELVIVPGAGHLETSSPTTTAWPIVLSTIKSMITRQWRRA